MTSHVGHLVPFLGSLKEQDTLINMIQGMAATKEARVDAHGGSPLPALALDVRGAIARAEALIARHVEAIAENPDARTELSTRAPDLSAMYLPLPLVRALDFMDERTAVVHRRFVPPSFAEVRRIIDLAVVYAVAPRLQLITFDADETIYPDSGSLTLDAPACSFLPELLDRGLHVALCTAAGYTDASKYEARLAGLLRRLATSSSSDALSRFAVMGGECNYLLVPARRSDGSLGLDYVPEAAWKDGRGVRWDRGAVQHMLDVAEATLREVALRLRLNTRVVRKERAVGLIQADASQHFVYEVLEEIALTVQDALSGLAVPHCAFNGGRDVWVDVGNKALGIRALQAFFGVPAPHTLHVGDRFTQTGNDRKAREAANTLWVSKPQETAEFIGYLLDELSAVGRTSDAHHAAHGAEGEA